MNDQEQQARKDIVDIGRRMYEHRFVAANDGNLSIRMDSGDIIATPTGVSKGFMTEESLVRLNRQGVVIGDGRVSTEIKMHLGVYRARADVRAVVHAHPPISTAFSIAEIPLNPHLLAEVVVGLGAIPVAEYQPPSTQELADTVQHYISTNNAVLMAHHGAITVGETLEQAYFRMETVEHFAHINYLCHQLGGAKGLPPEEIKRLIGMRSLYGIKSPGRDPVKHNGSEDRAVMVEAIVREVLARVAGAGPA
ncbi:class II aldolase/adducin family protein [bacterium]|nr:class II aldolase/adducin family protein [candidate division CSSED10-310 bacterium]